MRPCYWTGCTAEGTHFPMLCVPAEGVPIDAHIPAQAGFDVAVCPCHARQIRADELLAMNPQLRAWFARGVGTGDNRLPADFGRAFVTAKRFDGPEHRAALARKEQASCHAA